MDWLYENLALNLRDEAVQITNHLITCSLINGVTSSSHDDVDGQGLYRFNIDKIQQWTTSYQERYLFSCEFLIRK